jgi:hypothetical protein
MRSVQQQDLAFARLEWTSRPFSSILEDARIALESLISYDS